MFTLLHDFSIVNTQDRLTQQDVTLQLMMHEPSSQELNYGRTSIVVEARMETATATSWVSTTFIQIPSLTVFSLQGRSMCLENPEGSRCEFRD